MTKPSLLLAVLAFPRTRAGRGSYAKGYLALFFALFLTPVLKTYGQTDNARLRYFALNADSLRLDTLSIIPGSLQLWAPATVGSDSAALVEGLDYRVELASGTVYFRPEKKPDSLGAAYRVFPLDFSRRYAHKDRMALDTLDLFQAPFTYTPPRYGERSYLDMGGLDYSGSFSRGLSFGNRQDVVLNSSLNLQLSGMLRDVEIEAAITDNNIPVQPEGNTQQLQEFDKVFIRLRRDPHELTVGDFELRRPDSYFMNLFRRLQGAQYRGAVLSEKGGQFSFGASAAVARGQYRRQFLIPVEGNQGPYLLRGNNNERFIIVLAGSERVYIDGELMQRGAENDYIIDYNAGELIFMPSRIITKDLRIQVEFEYSERSYFRSLAFGQMGYSSADSKLDVRLNAFTEQDGRNQTLDAPLSSRDRNILRDVGDSIQLALAPAYDTASFDPGRILYRVVDSLGYDTVFVYTTSSSENLYQVGFSQVGQGLGNYRLANSLANGRVYEWVAPLGGIPQGEFEPVRQLPAPLARQLVVLGADWRPFKEGEWMAEAAFSQRDVNTFSTLNDADDSGLGLVLGMRQAIPLGRDTARRSSETGGSSIGGSNGWKLIADARYEFADDRLEPIENYRPMEFGRDWNLGTGLATTDEHWFSGGLEVQRGNSRSLGYRLDHYSQTDAYTGWRQGGSLMLREGGFRALVNGSYLKASTDSSASSFLRPRVDLSQSWKGWSLRVYSEMDDIRFRGGGGDTLTAGTIYYDLLQTTLGTADSGRNSYSLTHRVRRDKGALGEGLALSAVAHEILVNGRLSSWKNQRLSWTFTWRDLDVLDTSLISAQAEAGYLGRLEYGGQWWSGFVSGDLLYELGTASEPRRSFAYVQVPAGEGQFSWNDYNANGVAELDEFELAAFADQANFIRVFTPTDEYIRADVLNTQYSVSVQPKALWPSAQGLGGFLTRFSGQSIWQLNRKVLEGAGSAAYVPLETDLEDTSLVSVAKLFRNTVWFNRSRPEFALEYTYQDNRSVGLITGGAEERINRDHEFIVRAALSKKFNIRGEGRLGRRLLTSEAFATRDYALPFQEGQIQLNYQNSTAYRIGLRYGLGSSRNETGIEQLFSQEAGIEGRYNLVGKSSLDLEASVVLVEFSGESASPVAFAMLEGLQNGTNLLWNLGYDRKLSRFLQLGLNYEGRKTGTAPIAHIGRAQLRAIF
ncbi:MAG: hypothetical protein GC205_02520 [Bacteroidetes bacterium]|nr:hypothetical protein [Bacteroidota bacterium]